MTQQRLSDLIGPYWGTYRIAYRVLQPLLDIPYLPEPVLSSRVDVKAGFVLSLPSQGGKKNIYEESTPGSPVQFDV